MSEGQVEQVDTALQQTADTQAQQTETQDAGKGTEGTATQALADQQQGGNDNNGTAAVKTETPKTETGKTETPKVDAEFKWSDDWRDRMARGNEAVAKRLARYASPEAVAEALANAQEKISSGQLKSPAPKDNPEALARWREENGIPQKPEDYDLTLENGLTLGEEDTEAVSGFLKAMHERNTPPDVVKQAVSWYKQYEMAQLAKVAEADKNARIETEKAMIEEWGPSVHSEKNSVLNFLKANGLEELQFARLPDGRAVGNNFEFVRKLSALAREINPGDTVVPGSSNPMKSIGDEMAAIEKKMGTVSYTENDAKRYMELLTAKDKLSARQ